MNTSGDRVHAQSPIHGALSYQQQRLWFLDELEHGGETRLTALAVRVRGKVVIDQFHTALQEVLDFHPILRSRFLVQEGNPERETVSVAASQVFTSADLGDAKKYSPEQIRDALRGAILKPFRLDQAPLLRIHLLLLGNDDAILGFAAHSIICDERSLRIVLQELVTAYDSVGIKMRPASTASG